MQKKIQMKYALQVCAILITVVALVGCPGIVDESDPTPEDGGAVGEPHTSPNIGNLVYVPAGSFQRDEEPESISVITESYYMNEHSLTQAQFEAIMGVNPSYFTDGEDAPDRPVESVSWYDAIAFANKLSIAEGLTQVYTVSGIDFATLTYSEIPTGDSDETEIAIWNAVAADWDADGYRLPTEMEWMWAAMGADQDSYGDPVQDGINRTGYSKPFAGYDGSNSIDDYVWYDANSGWGPNPVGTKLSNELGLYDMSGNVDQWNWGWSAVYPSGILTDYRGAETSTHRISRGVNWLFKAVPMLSYRLDDEPQYRSFFARGFRLVRRNIIGE